VFQPEWALTSRPEFWSMQDNAEQQDQLDRLKQELGEGNCVAFVGAGPSMDARYPSWQNLVRRLGCEAGLAMPEVPEGADGRGAIGREIRGFAQECRTKLGEEAYHEFLKKEFHPAGKLQFTPLHSYLVTMPFSALITTNFDPCLEEAGRLVLRQPLRVRRYPDLPIRDLGGVEPPFVFHIHGLAYENAHDSESLIPTVESLVLTENDFQRAYLEQVSPITPLLQEVLLEYTAVFIGVGFDDPTLLEALELSRQKSEHLKDEHMRCRARYRDRTHFAFRPMIWRKSRSPSGEPRRDREKERVETETWPTERRISVIRYQQDDTIGHTRLSDMLQHLSEATQRRTVGSLRDEWSYARRI
jgi:hypothetical protein